MKILFSADQHLNLRRKKVPKEFEYNRFWQYIRSLESLIIEYNINVVIFGGDFFDKIPTLEELGLFCSGMRRLADTRACVWIIDGNHEATSKNKTFMDSIRPMLEPDITIITECVNMGGMDFLPYCKLKTDLKDYEPKSEILITHVRGEIPPHVKPEVDLDLFSKWNYVFAGDLHSYTNCQRNIYYPGSPLTTSFVRNRVRGGHGVFIFDTANPGGHTWIELDLPQLIRRKLKVGDKKPKEHPEDFVIYEMEGTLDELANIKEENLDKKIALREQEDNLLLYGKNSIEEEIGTFAEEVLKLGDTSRQDLLNYFNDNIKNASLG